MRRYTGTIETVEKLGREHSANVAILIVAFGEDAVCKSVVNKIKWVL